MTTSLSSKNSPFQHYHYIIFLLPLVATSLVVGSCMGNKKLIIYPWYIKYYLYYK
jgi:hypothetical protein